MDKNKYCVQTKVACGDLSEPESEYPQLLSNESFDFICDQDTKDKLITTQKSKIIC